MQSDLFMAVIARYLTLAKKQEEEHLDTLRGVAQMVALAPSELQAAITILANALGLLPEAIGYLDNGSPMYRLEDVAEKLGLTLEKAEAMLNAFMAECEAMGLPNEGIVDSAQIHRMQ